VLEPLTECPIDLLDNCDPTPVYTPVDPLSVVFRPSPEFIAKMLGLPREGILLGRLYAGGFELPVEVRLPERAMYQHVLVVGTTGAGKTVLLKNMALSAIYTVRNAHSPRARSTRRLPPHSPPARDARRLPAA
jgi:DNA helicase HerA-like ATPase